MPMMKARMPTTSNPVYGGAGGERVTKRENADFGRRWGRRGGAGRWEKEMGVGGVEAGELDRDGARADFATGLCFGDEV